MSYAGAKSDKLVAVTTHEVADLEEHEIQTRPTVCGVRRALFLWTLAIITLAAVAVGLGIGLSQKAKSTTQETHTIVNPAFDAAAAASSSLARASSTHAQTVYSSATQTASAQPTSGTASTNCPATNGTTYSSGGHTYLILCQNDIQADNKVDLGRHYQPTFTSCIDSCATLGANRTDISAVYWVDYEPSQTGTCWCFGGTSRSNGAFVSTWAANNLAWIQS